MLQWRITFYATALKRVDALEFAWQLSYHNLDVVAKSCIALWVQTDSAEDLQKFTWAVNAQAGALVFSRIETYIEGQWVSLDNYLQEVA